MCTALRSHTIIIIVSSSSFKQPIIVALDCFALPLHFIFQGQERRGGGGQKHSWWGSVQPNHYSLSAVAHTRTHTKQMDDKQTEQQQAKHFGDFLTVKPTKYSSEQVWPSWGVKNVIFRKKRGEGVRLIWAGNDPCPFVQCQIKYLCSGFLSLCCDMRVFNPAQYPMVNPAGVQPFQALMIIGFSLHEFEIVFKYGRQIKHKTQNIQPCL